MVFSVLLCAQSHISKETWPGFEPLIVCQVLFYMVVVWIVALRQSESKSAREPGSQIARETESQRDRWPDNEWLWAGSGGGHVSTGRNDWDWLWWTRVHKEELMGLSLGWRRW